MTFTSLRFISPKLILAALSIQSIATGLLFNLAVIPCLPFNANSFTNFVKSSNIEALYNTELPVFLTVIS